MAPSPTNSNSDADAGSDTYFNDLSQQPQSAEQTSAQKETAGSKAPRAKRIACVLCRKRKLRCDGAKPACGTCQRLAHDCSYDEMRRKSGPKRGYVKALEARLAQVETLLKAQEPAESSKSSSAPPATNPLPNPRHGVGMAPDEFDMDVGGADVDTILNAMDSNGRFAQDQFNARGSGDGTFSWEVIGLGLNEPLPNQDVIDELTQVYFEKVHPSMPMIHRPRFMAAMNLAPHMRPSICLRYAMWTVAASVTDKYESLQDHFYQRARRYAQEDEMKGHGEAIITLGHVQAWFIIASYEFKMTYFPRAWMSTGRAARLAQMMGLHRLDGAALDVKQCLPPPKDWTEREERRRTFWMCFCEDRYASIGTGWPMTFDEKDILTSLPADEEAFEKSKPAPSMSLNQALDPEGASNLSSLAGVIVMAALFGRNLTHLHRPGPGDNDDDLNGDFWRRHRAMDNILLNTSLALPDNLRLPLGLAEPNVVFLNLCIHTSTICLHQAAIFKADKNRMSTKISAESKVRCITAATEIASIMRMIAHQDMSATNPFATFCLYVAARVFVQYLKSRSQDHQIRASLQFLLSAMQALKKKNPLTESFIVQLDVDLEAAGMRDARLMRSAQQASKNHPDYPHFQREATQGPSLTDSIGLKQPPRTFGNSGLAKHSSPSENHFGNVMQQDLPPGYAYGMSSAERTTPFSYISQDGRTFSVPSRGKTPSADPSPQTLADEMEVSCDTNNDHATPSSNSNSHHNFSSHASSNHSFTPPSLHQDEFLPPQTQAPFATTYAQHNNHLKDVNITTMFNPNDNAFSDFDFPAFRNPGHNSVPNADPFPVQSTWSMGTTGLTPGASTGLTPTGDIMNLSDAEWGQVLDGFTGWEGVGSSHGHFVDMSGKPI